jgi:hypothetical protein
MSVCEYCGEKVGWFQTNHPACVTKASASRNVVEKLVFDGTLAGRSYDELFAEVQKVLTDSRVSFTSVRDALLQGANDAASQIALKSPVSKAEFDRLVRIFRGLDGSLNVHLSDEFRAQMVQRRWFATAQLTMSYVLWQVLNNITPNFDETGDTVAFNLRTGELPIFQTGNCVTYAEERTVTTNRSRSYQGLSLPVGGGIYYHIGGSQGHQERTSGLLPLDGGKILITTKSLYFGGQEKTFRIPLDHILRYQPYVDGVSVCEDRKAPKVFVFDYRGMDVGWFFYNLLSALSNPQASFKASEESQSAHQTEQCVTNLQNAFDTFRAANETFTNLFKNAVVGERTITTEDLAAYATPVEGLFAAALKLEEQFQFASTTAREKYHEARQSMETSWATFASVDDGQMNGDAYVPFLDEVAAFMKARNEAVDCGA